MSNKTHKNKKSSLPVDFKKIKIGPKTVYRRSTDKLLSNSLWFHITYAEVTLASPLGKPNRIVGKTGKDILCHPLVHLKYL